MLSSILSRSDCAKCRFCCSFRRTSLWETPRFEPQLLERLRRDYPEAKFRKVSTLAGKDSWTIDLSGRYKTDDPDEEVLCWFNHGKGCILGEDEPFDCKTWPVQLMDKDGELVIVLTPTCPVVSPKPIEEVRALVDSGLAKKMLEYASRFPEYVRDYYEGHKDRPVLAVIEGGQLRRD